MEPEKINELWNQAVQQSAATSEPTAQVFARLLFASRSPVVGAQGGEPELGDTVRHIPSGEEWLVAYVRDGKLAACGWPDELVPASDCVLVQRMPLGKKLDLRRELSRSTGHRAEHARALLRSACLTYEFGVSPTGSPEGDATIAQKGKGERE